MDAGQQSSSPALSSAPPTPDHPPLSPPPLLGPPPTTAPLPDAAKASASSTAPPTKRPRRKREAAAPADEKEKSKEKKPRKPRATKASVAAAAAAAAKEAASAGPPQTSITAWTERKPRAPSMFPHMQQRSPSPPRDAAMHATSPNATRGVVTSPSGPSRSEAVYSNPNLGHVATPPPPRPASRGLVFDPIRGAAMENTASQHVPPSPSHPHVNRASASPSITSLIDPPGAPAPHTVRVSSTSTPSAPLSPHTSMNRPASLQSNSSTLNQPVIPPPPTTAHHGTAPPPAPNFPTEMEVDRPASHPPARSATSAPTKSAASSAGPTPSTKPVRVKEAPPPLPGSGLLPSIGGPVTNGAATNGKFGTNIWLTFPLKGKTNVTINYAREVEQKYGFAALHPRLAARNERKRLIAAAGADLEREINAKKPKGSGDDMSVDLSDEDAGSGDDGDHDMSGVEGPGAAKAKKKDDEAEPHPMLLEAGLDPQLYYVGKGDRIVRRRKRKVEDYDRTDDFIDDTEMAWQEQALMAKDGFFVYSGPLVVEGDSKVERADGAKSTSTRGRGRGRRANAHAGVTHADVAAAHAQLAPAPGQSRPGSVPPSNGSHAAHGAPGAATLRADGLPTSGPGSRGGRGSRARGGATVRKPRVTKAERARMDEEKRERERVGAGLVRGAGGADAPAVPVLGVPSGLAVQAYPGHGS